MSEYRAVVSIHFDDDDLKEIAERFDFDKEKLDVHEIINAELDGIIGHSWVEQLFKDKKPSITRLTRGLEIEINDFE